MIGDAIRRMVTMSAVEITAETFTALTPGKVVRVSFSGCMANGSGIDLKVGRRSYSKKYAVTTLALDPVVGKASPMARIKLYARASGRISMALGDMAVQVTSFEVLN